MTTPVERGAEAVEAKMRSAYKCPEPGGIGWFGGSPTDLARAVFGSIDREGLARMLYRRDMPHDADFWDNGLPGNFKRQWLAEADAIIAWLTAKTGDAS